MATEGGRFDFEDGGAYVGCWSEGRAHGPGLVTGPRGQGEFSGSWQDGFEASGVYIWPSGNTYEGEWRQGKRHGLGVEAKGRWVYRGEWMTGFRGRYGVRCSDSSGARYEGTWQLGMQDGAGVETYADGGTYSGCWFHGTRHGLGVRQSVPFGLAAPYRDEAADATAASDTAASATAGRHRDESLTSLRSARPDDAAVTEDAERPEGRRRRRLPGDEFRAGFVLSSRHCEAEVTASSGEGAEDSNPNSPAGSGELRAGEDAEYEEPLDPSVTEVFCGEWKQDRRCGLGVAERSDGLKYEGEWEGNRRHGYGATTFPDGSCEAGKYRGNLLNACRLFLLKSSRLRERVDTAVREARVAMAEALKRAENAQSR
uniref:MORN repeat-containing protein n=1 Tax=Macrostomum lignano TaxID=282301 RepID=A0A1I8GR58_9PLAT